MNEHSILLNERDLLRFKIISGGFMKSIPCTMVLRLMDTEEFGCDYCRALGLVLELFPEIDRVERMEKFGLELESSKSRLIEFGRFAEQNRRARGECKPETFDFLGFTFYCSKTRKGGFVPKVQTSRKKFEQKVRAYKNWIYDNRNRPMREIIKELNVKLIGHYRYYGVTWNFRKITTFLHRVQQFLFKAMNRRGCRRAYTWNGFVEMLKYYPLAKPKTYYCLY